jgi:hypothetical protein
MDRGKTRDTVDREVSVEASGHRSVKSSMTSRALDDKLAFPPSGAVQRSVCGPPPRYRPIARDRRGSFLGRASVNKPG